MMIASVCCRMSSVVVCNTPRRRNAFHQGAARDGRPVVLRPVRATLCFRCADGITSRRYQTTAESMSEDLKISFEDQLKQCSTF